MERLDFLGAGLLTGVKVPVRFGDFSVDVVDEKLDFLSFFYHAKPPKAYNCIANIPVSEMSRLYSKMLALKPATGIKPEIGCDGLMYMIMKKRQPFAYHDRYIK